MPGYVTAEVVVNDTKVNHRAGSIRVSKAIGQRSTAEFDVRASVLMPVEGQESGVFDHGICVFNGTIHEIERTPIAEVPGSEAWYRCLCVGWEHRLDRVRIPCAAFYGKSAGEIVQEIIDTYAPGEVHIGAIEPGMDAATLGTVIYRGISVTDAIADLAEKSDYATWVDNVLMFYFVPRTYKEAVLEITSENKNYRAPKITSTRADYYNAVAMAISHEAFPSRLISFAGDLSYPQFDVYDPNYGMTPVGIDIINSIKLNGVEQTFGVDAEGATTAFTYIQGQTWIKWSVTSVPPGAGDIVAVDFYPIGSNIVSLRDETEIAARAAIEFDAGVYQAYLEDLDCKDQTEALARCAAFLNIHAPARANPALAAGSMPREYSWTMFSHELRVGAQADPNPVKYVSDLWPGTIIRFKPSTPTTEDTRVLIQSIEAREVKGAAPAGQLLGAGMLQYDITGIDCTKLAGYFQFYKALAELGGSGSTSPNPSSGSQARIGDQLRITLGYSGTITVIDGYASKELYLPPKTALRLSCAVADLDVAGTGAATLADAEYSTDGGATWLPIFDVTTGALAIPDGLLQMVTPYAQFAGYPAALDLPRRCLVRGNVKAFGTGAAGLKQELIGEVCSA